MTQQERMDIFSKEIITIKDIQNLFDISYSSAAGIIRSIKAKKDRLNIAGAVHIQDYIEFYNLPMDRYIVTVVAERDKESKLNFYQKGIV